MTEAELQRRILLRCCRGPVRLFRNNTAQGWAGKSQRFTRAGTVAVAAGDVLVRKAYPLHAGLCNGSADLIGWLSVVVTPDMVGQRVAIFLAPEIKTATGSVAEDQSRFIDAVNAAGGRAGIVRSEDQAALLCGLTTAGPGAK